MQISEPSRFGWALTLVPEEAIPLDEYNSVRVAFLPAFAQLPSRPSLILRLTPGGSVDLLPHLDLTREEWQVIDLPLDQFELEGALESVVFTGNLEGTFYLDDLRLVSEFQRPVTAVLESRDSAAPSDFGLGQNYPNPFNSATVIGFDLPQAGSVELAVYNLAGQQVAILVDGIRAAGRYTLDWDGRDQNGRELASGLYLYRLRAGAAVQTRKMLLLR